MARLKQRFPHILALSRVLPAQQPRERVVVTRRADPVEVGDQFLAAVGGRRPSEDESRVLREAYEAALAADRSL